MAPASSLAVNSKEQIMSKTDTSGLTQLGQSVDAPTSPETAVM